MKRNNKIAYDNLILIDEFFIELGDSFGLIKPVIIK